MNSLINYLRELENDSYKRNAEGLKTNKDLEISKYEEGYQDAIMDIWNWISANKFNIEDRNGNEFPVINVEDW